MTYDHEQHHQSPPQLLSSAYRSTPVTSSELSEIWQAARHTPQIRWVHGALDPFQVCSPVPMYLPLPSYTYLVV